jgi:hypothetical protein
MQTATAPLTSGSGKQEMRRAADGGSKEWKWLIGVVSARGRGRLTPEPARGKGNFTAESRPAQPANFGKSGFDRNCHRSYFFERSL